MSTKTFNKALSRDLTITKVIQDLLQSPGPYYGQQSFPLERVDEPPPNAFPTLHKGGRILPSWVIHSPLRHKHGNDACGLPEDRPTKPDNLS